MHESKHKTLQDFAAELEQTLTREEFVDAFKDVVGAVKSARDEIADSHDAHKTEIASRLDGAITTMTQQLSDAHEKIDFTSTNADTNTKAAVSEAVTSLKAEIAAIRDIIPDVPDVAGMIDAIKIPTIDEIVNNLPQYGEQYRDGLELLPDEEKLSIEAIKDLRKELDELKKGLKASAQVNGSGVILQRGALMGYDLTDLLDGLTTTFQLPTFWKILEIKSTSTPIIFRPGVDYTVDGSLMTITFTSQINAATTLAAGQTLLVLYQQP